ncbi:MAG: tetratricopeptide repeat protein [Terracidiphilus sp.]
MNRQCGIVSFVCFLFLSFTGLAQPAADEAVRQAMQQGAAAMTSGQFDQAVEAYTRVTHLQPAFAEGFFNLGLAEEQAGHLDEAHTALEQAIHLKPAIRGAHLFLGTIAYKRDRFKESEDDFLAETRIDPRSAKAFMWLGVSRLAEEHPEAAIAPLDKAHEIDPTDVDTLYHRGRAYFLVAKDSYAAMFKANPDSFRVHQVLAESAAEAYRAEEAIAQYKTAIELAPRQSGLHESLGDQYWTSGDLDKAAEAYKAELEIDPADTMAKFKLGSLYVVHANSAEGVPLLRQALQQDPTLRDAHYYLGDGLLDLDQNAEAAHEYELAIAADPTDDRAMTSYYRLAQAYKKLHRVDDAREALANYQRLKAQTQARQDSRRAQIVRKRSQLPVDNPDKLPDSVEP